MADPINLWQLLVAKADRSRLMIACGVPQRILQAGSDYDRLAAYAACMRLCQGHPVREHDTQIFRELTGLDILLCPESCAYLWHAAAYALAGLGEQPDAPDDCEITFVPPVPTAIPCLPIGNALYAAPTADLLGRLASPDLRAVSVTAGLDAFIKPNPYHARMLCARHDKGEALTGSEQDLCTAQTLRVMGKLCAERDLHLYIHADFAATEAWQTLLTYLYANRCLPYTVLVVANESQLRKAALLAGCVPNATDIPQVRVGVASVPEREELLTLYATLLPIGVLPPIEQ